jgi:hypothetical protein
MNICDCFTRCFYRPIQTPLLEKAPLLSEDSKDCKLDSKSLESRIPGELPLPSPPDTPYISSDDDNDQFLGGLDEE